MSMEVGGHADEGGGRRRRRGRGRRLNSDINVTPFVDVLMVLLLVFMVAAPLMTVGVPLKLPRTAATPLPVEQEEPLTVNVDADGRVYVQRQEVPREELVTRLAAIQAERSSDRVFLRADASIDYGRVAEVMGALNAGGFRNIGLVTDPAQRGAPAPSTAERGAAAPRP
jgi:biopolymer transport protein TolR